MPMSPRLTSSTTSAPAVAASRDRALEHGDAGRAERLEERRLRLDHRGRRRRTPRRRSGEALEPGRRRRSVPRPRSSAACGSMPTHSEPRASSAASRRAPNVTGSTGRVVGTTGTATGVRAARASGGRSRPRRRSAAKPRSSSAALQFGQHPHRRGRIAEHRRADRDRRRAGEHELQRVQPGADAAHAENRQVRAGPGAPARRSAPPPGGSPGRTGRR